jgi:hypothetical protein
MIGALKKFKKRDSFPYLGQVHFSVHFHVHQHCCLKLLMYLVKRSVKELRGMLLSSRGWLQGLQDDQIGGRSVQLTSLNK